MRILPHQTSLQVCALTLWPHVTAAGRALKGAGHVQYQTYSRDSVCSFRQLYLKQS